jgi:hypothetical protein
MRYFMQVKTTSRDGVVTIHDAELVRENHKTVVVRLPDGNVIKRHKVKHAVHIEDKKNEQQTTELGS